MLDHQTEQRATVAAVLRRLAQDELLRTGMKKAELARKTHVGYQTYLDFINGGVPSLDVLEIIAERYKYHINLRLVPWNS